MGYRIFWGDTHDNTYTHAEQNPPLDEVLRYAAGHLDFYAAAYYTSQSAAFKPGGHQFEHAGKQDIILEDWKSPDRLAREWAEVQECTRAANRPGDFVTFPGYEWQGDGAWGDHNVCHKTEGGEIARVETLPELYAALRGREALAIPHHTAYRPGNRGPRWEYLDEALSPYAEIYSVHGCSETDEDWIGLRTNSHMGPGAGGGAYQAALDRGLHLGAVCSTDNWGRMPGRFDHGVMAALASECTRDALWEAMKARRVYGSTGDRIELDFSVNGAPMGSAIADDGGPRRICAAVRGADAIDRIELLRNGRVIATHCHQGTWNMPRAGERTRFKLRLEMGWGPRPNEAELPDRAWNGRIRLSDGRFTGWHPCWISPGQTRPALDGDEARFAMLTTNRDAVSRWQNAHVFEFEATPDAEVRIDLNGLQEIARAGDLAAASRILWFRDDCLQMLARKYGLSESDLPRQDPSYHMAPKCKIHRAIPEAGYTADMEFEDDGPLTGETHYRVRVEQRNGQRAWSSPVWVGPRR